jgi:hypothetical protein
MRVLHLIDAASVQAAPVTLALMADALGRLGAIEQHVLLLGGSSLRHAAVAAGLTGDQVAYQPVPYGHALAGWFAVRRRLAQLTKPAPLDVIHAWSIESFTFAALTLPKVPRLLSLTVTPAPPAVRWLRQLISRIEGATLLPISNTIRRALLAGGVEESRVRVLRPALDASRCAACDRAALRAQWNATDPAARVVALLGDPADAADAFDASYVAGLAAESLGRDHPQALNLRLLVHPATGRRMRAQRQMRQLDRGDRMVLEPRLSEPWRVLPACDFALVLDDAKCSGRRLGLSPLWAMASNCTLIAAATYAVSEVLEDHHSALLGRPGDVRHLAHRLRTLLDDPRLAWQLRDAARHEAFSFFSRVRYCEALRGVYEQVQRGDAVQVPALPVTGGLRFTGRA